MPRQPRRALWTDAACYHIFNRGHNRATVFADDADRRYFLDLLARDQQRFAVRLSHYRLMGNNFHLWLPLADARQLARVMAGLLLAYVCYCQRRYGFVGHLGQGRFKSPAIEAELYAPWVEPWGGPGCQAPFRTHRFAPFPGAALKALRASVRRGAPFGEGGWRQATARRLGLESTLRRRGRPSKQPPEDPT